MELENKVLRYIQKHSLIKKGDRILVALSGGPDSVCLLHVLRHLQHYLQFSIFAAHFDHGIRKDSEEDSLFCKDLCTKYRVPFFLEKGHLKKSASEDISRRRRYEFLKRSAEYFSCHSIATGHQQDDQAETVLLHLLRGTGIQGLSGIRPWRFFSGDSKIRLIRPLLSVSREEIIKFLKEKKFDYVTDTSNIAKRYQRNKVRLELLPLMEEFNPHIKEVLFRMAEIVSADYLFISSQAASFLNACYVNDLPGYRFSRREFIALPLSLQREALRQAISNLCKTEYRVEFDEIEQLLRFFLSAQSKKIKLPGKITASREKRYLYLTQSKSQSR